MRNFNFMRKLVDAVRPAAHSLLARSVRGRLIGLLLLALLTPMIAAAQASDTPAPTQETAATQEASAEEADGTSPAAAAEPDNAEQAESSGVDLSTMMLVIGVTAVAGAGFVLVMRDRAAADDVV